MTTPTEPAAGETCRYQMTRGTLCGRPSESVRHDDPGAPYVVMEDETHPYQPAPLPDDTTLRAELQRIAGWPCVACDDQVRHVCHRHAVADILAGLRPILGEVSYPCECTTGGNHDR